MNPGFPIDQVEELENFSLIYSKHVASPSYIEFCSSKRDILGLIRTYTLNAMDEVSVSYLSHLTFYEWDEIRMKIKSAG